MSDLICCPKCKNELVQTSGKGKCFSEDFMDSKLKGKRLSCTCGQSFSFFKDDIPDLIYYSDQDSVQVSPQTDHLPSCQIEAMRLNTKFWLNYIVPMEEMFVSDRILHEYNRKKRKLKILDIGLGIFDGYKFKNNYSAISNMTEIYYGVDASAAQLTRYHPLTNVFLLRAFGEYIPLSDSSFDIVLILSTLDHTFRPELVIREAHRCLVDGGMLCIGLNNDQSWFKRIFKKEAERRRRIHAHEHRFNFGPYQVEILMTNCTFKEITCLDMAYFKAPRIVENLLARALVDHSLVFLRVFDSICKKVLYGMGGYFFVIGRK